MLKELLLGNIVLIGCCIVYLLWWSIAFNPMRSYPIGPKVLMFIVIVLLAIVGLYFIIGSMLDMDYSVSGISNFYIIIAGVLSYVVLFLLTYFLMHRQVTTELALIVGWTVLELCLVNSIYRVGSINSTLLIILSIVIVIGAVIGMVCYSMYYSLYKTTAFYCGMVPLIVCAIIMALIDVIVWIGL